MTISRAFPGIPGPGLSSYGLMHRRKFVSLALGAAALGLAGSARANSLPSVPARGGRFKALAFDGFPILDPRPVFVLAEELFPGQGQALSNVWRSRQFEYSWLRAAGRRYADFWQVTGDALVYAARATGVELTDAKRQRLMDAYLQLKTWPEVLPVLRRFQAAGLTNAFLSNFSPGMLAAATAGAGLEGLITRAISTDEVQSYKPDPRAYQLGVDRLGLAREEILFVAFGAWDAAGAKWFGYPTFWVNRLKQPAEELSVEVDGMGRDLLDLEKFVFAS
jgi:2-haloacid dehalogenase